MMKKLICTLVAVCSLATTCIPFSGAATISFDITDPDDTISRKVEKNTDGDNYFYVTPHYFSKNGVFTVKSIRYDNRSVFSMPMPLNKSNINLTSRQKYETHAAGGYYYFLSGVASVAGLNVSGNYTP